MNSNIRIQLITPITGGRVLRIEAPHTGLSVERKLDSEKPLVAYWRRKEELEDAEAAAAAW